MVKFGAAGNGAGAITSIVTEEKVVIGDRALEECAKEAGGGVEEDGGARGRLFQQLPTSPGRHRIQGLPLRMHAHLWHLAMLLQRQQQVLEGAGARGTL